MSAGSYLYLALIAALKATVNAQAASEARGVAASPPSAGGLPSSLGYNPAYDPHALASVPPEVATQYGVGFVNREGKIITKDAKGVLRYRVLVNYNHHKITNDTARTLDALASKPNTKQLISTEGVAEKTLPFTIKSMELTVKELHQLHAEHPELSIEHDRIIKAAGVMVPYNAATLGGQVWADALDRSVNGQMAGVSANSGNGVNIYILDSGGAPPGMKLVFCTSEIQQQCTESKCSHGLMMAAIAFTIAPGSSYGIEQILFDDCTGAISSLISALSNISYKPPGVISGSIAEPGESASFASMFDHIEALGFFSLYASGDYGTYAGAQSITPAQYAINRPSSMVVGALSQLLSLGIEPTPGIQPPTYTTYGPGVDIYAIGDKVCINVNGVLLCTTGTSPSTAEVAGIAALQWQQGTPVETLKSAILDNSISVHSAWKMLSDPDPTATRLMPTIPGSESAIYQTPIVVGAKQLINGKAVYWPPIGDLANNMELAEGGSVVAPINFMPPSKSIKAATLMLSNYPDPLACAETNIPPGFALQDDFFTQEINLPAGASKLQIVKQNGQYVANALDASGKVVGTPLQLPSKPRHMGLQTIGRYKLQEPTYTNVVPPTPMPTTNPWAPKSTSMPTINPTPGVTKHALRSHGRALQDDKVLQDILNSTTRSENERIEMAVLYAALMLGVGGLTAVLTKAALDMREKDKKGYKSDFSGFMRDFVSSIYVPEHQAPGLSADAGVAAAKHGARGADV